jgi:hypothetical protein
MSVREPLDLAWTPEAAVSAPGQTCANPRIVSDGLSAWVAYETPEGPLTSVTVAIIEDGAEPIPRCHQAGTSSFSGNLETDLRSEGGHIWVSWKGGPDALSWSEFDFAAGRFTTPVTEPLGSGTVRDARDRIRALVLGP